MQLVVLRGGNRVGHYGAQTYYSEYQHTPETLLSTLWNPRQQVSQQVWLLRKATEKLAALRCDLFHSYLDAGARELYSKLPLGRGGTLTLSRDGQINSDSLLPLVRGATRTGAEFSEVAR